LPSSTRLPHLEAERVRDCFLMMTLRKSAERGTTRIGWLDSRHTFSFGAYADPEHHRFRTLRVINDDRVAPSGGFDTHPHRDMEIFT